MKKRYCLWMLTLVLAIIGLCNLFLNITVIAVLRISQGMEAMEVIPDENLVKFYGRTDLDKVHVTFSYNLINVLDKFLYLCFFYDSILFLS